MQRVRRSVELRPLLCVALDGQSGRDHGRLRQMTHGQWYGREQNTRQILPVVRIGVLGPFCTIAADSRESARSGSSTGIWSHRHNTIANA